MADALKKENQSSVIQFPNQGGHGNIQLTPEQLQEIISQAVRRAVETSKPKRKPKKEKSASPYKSNGVLKPKKAEPLRSADEFKMMADYFLNSNDKHSKRNYMMLVFGCTIGNRASDLLSCHIYDVINPDGTVRDYYEAYEKKTGKLNKNKITSTAKEAIKLYLDSLPSYNMNDYLIKSQKGGMMSIQQMWRILNKAATECGIEQNIGTHTLRKTYGYTARMANSGDSVMDTLQSKFKHSDQRTTKTYLSITQDEIDELADSVDEALRG